MKRLLTGALAALLSFAALAATTTPPSLLNPAGSTTGQAIISTGPSTAPVWGAVPLTGISGTLAVSHGGTGSASASGTALDNITGFASTGFVKRTGAGAYSFIADPLPIANGGTGQTSASAALTALGALPTAGGTVIGVVNLTNSTTSTGSTSGALVVTGGVGVGNNVFVAGSVVSGGGFTGEVSGTTTNNDASAGSVAEYKSSDIPIGSPVALTSGTTANITSVSLTAGDWLCSGTASFLQTSSTALTTISAATSTTSATMPLTEQGGYAALNMSFATGSAYVNAISVGNWRYKLSSTTSVYLVAKAFFSASTESAYGFLGCSRRR